MSSMLRQRVQCECGNYVTANTFKTHIISKNCTASQEFKSWVEELSEIRRAHNGAYPVISNDYNALLEKDWFVKSIFNREYYKKLTWDKPRPLGAIPATTRQKISQNRMGSNNPYVKSRLNNAKNLIESFEATIIDAWNKSLNTKEPWLPIFNQILTNHKDVLLTYADVDFKNLHIKRGYNKKNLIVAKILNINIDELIKQMIVRRGIKISEGQLKSETFSEIASQNAISLQSGHKITKPQLLLYDKVLNFDSSASIEYTVKTTNGYRSYDIYSSKLHAVLEMHGRVWHDLQSTKEQMKEMVYANIENDVFKRDWAESIGLKYFVFWDDQIESWDKTLEELFEKS